MDFEKAFLEACEAEDVGAGGEAEGVGRPEEGGGVDAFVVEGGDEAGAGGLEGVGAQCEGWLLVEGVDDAVPTGAQFGGAGSVEPVGDGFSDGSGFFCEAESCLDWGRFSRVGEGFFVEVMGGEELSDVVGSDGGWLVLEVPEEAPVSDEVVGGGGEGGAFVWGPVGLCFEGGGDGFGGEGVMVEDVGEGLGGGSDEGGGEWGLVLGWSAHC